MSSSLTVEILLALLTGVVAAAAYFSATRANREQAKAAGIAVDAGAYARAKEIYEGALSTLRTEMAEMRLETSRVRQSNDLLRQSNDALRLEVHRLSESNDALRMEIRRLSQAT